MYTAARSAYRRDGKRNTEYQGNVQHIGPKCIAQGDSRLLSRSCNDPHREFRAGSRKSSDRGTDDSRRYSSSPSYSNRAANKKLPAGSRADDAEKQQNIVVHSIPRRRNNASLLSLNRGE